MRHFEDLVASWAAAVAILTAAGGLFSYLRSLYRRTAGRRRALTEKLVLLSAGVQASYLEGMLGVPPYKSGSEISDENRTWVTRDAYVHAVSLAGLVHRLSITTRHGQFKPTLYRNYQIDLQGRSIEVTLGRTTFSELSRIPVGIAGSVGARRFGYSEVYYFGNPANYQTFAYSINDAGHVPAQSAALIQLIAQRRGVKIGMVEVGARGDEGGVTSWLQDQEVADARRDAVFNTLTVTSPMVGLDAEMGWLGPNLDLVRTFSSPQARLLTPAIRALRRLHPHVVTASRSRANLSFDIKREYSLTGLAEDPNSF